MEKRGAYKEIRRPIWKLRIKFLKPRDGSSEVMQPIEYIIESDHKLLELARSIGTPIPSRTHGPLIDSLTPKSKENANPNSLSRQHGEKAFPVHTDGAYLPTPPRYILMRYVQGIESPTPTMVCDLGNMSPKQAKIFQFDMWKTNSRTGSFYSTILSSDKRYYRYDRSIMTPSNPIQHNGYIFEEVVRQLPQIIINWHPNKTMLIDNWQSVHFRPEVQQLEIDLRKIQRIMIL